MTASHERGPGSTVATSPLDMVHGTSVIATKKPDCIFFFRCGNSAGPDGEHLLLSALGGLRESKKILCKQCNERFGGTIDRVLAMQLGSIGGLIGVRTARERRLLTALARDEKTGEEFRVDASGKLHYAEPRIVNEERSGEQVLMRMRFSSEAQVQKTLRDLRKKFSRVSVHERTESRHVRTRPITVTTNFGGDEGLRGVGKMALSHLAHHFPSVARQRGLEPFKTYVLDGGSDQFVWFDFSNFIDPAIEEFCPFAHRVAISLDAASGIACAHVSLYSTYGVAVLFGPVVIGETRTIVIDINPLAERAGAGVDVRETVVNDVAAVQLRRERHDSSTIAAHAQAGIVRLVRAQRKIAWESYVHPIVKRLGDTGMLAERERCDAIQNVLQDATQEILFQVVSCVSMIREPLLSVGDPGARLLRFLDALVSLTEKSVDDESGLSTFAECVVYMVRETFVQEIERRVARSTLDADFLSALLQGGRGRAIALAHLLRLIEMTMPEYEFLASITDNVLRQVNPDE